MASKVKTSWQNRIVGHGEKAAKDFKSNPLNWREHSKIQRAALNAVLSKVGWVTGVIENTRTGNLLDGHARVEEALKLNPETFVPYIQVDLSQEEENEILALLDPIGALATTDAEKLQELLATVVIDSDALMEVINGLLPPETVDITNEEPNLNDPNFNYASQFGVIVECENEQHQKKVFDELVSRGFKVKVVVV